MFILYEFECERCHNVFEIMWERDTQDRPRCEMCGCEMKKLISAPSFTFTDGSGTDGGQTLRHYKYATAGGSFSNPRLR